ncbi:hypothetical protein F5B21DRAFT_529306 [Xylaria acuta]|nr:hypothetical protein F5B21DRAFT_529306 [Xylaria acuta]
MESWENYNYYTTNATTWVELMNLSTAEFGLGYFPRGLWFNRKTILHLRNPNNQDLSPRPNSPTSRSTGATELTPLQDNRLCEASNFEDQLFNFYYEFIYTEVELAEKAADDVVDVEDVEAVTDLVRKMYSYDLLLYGARNTRAYEQQRHDLMSKSDGILGAVRDKVSNEWAKDLSPRGHMGWADDEWEKILALKSFLRDRLPPQRYHSNH